MQGSPEALRDRLDRVRERIGSAANRAGRKAEDVTLVAVSKTFPVEMLRAAIEAGITDLGENRAQELRQKAAVLGDAARWHFVGPLQSNKVRMVVGTAALIHSVESTSLAEAISGRAGVLGLLQDVLIEINVSGESSKHGATPETAVDLAGAVQALDNVKVAGLMTMAPFSEDRESSRPYFRELARLSKKVTAVVPGAVGLSMGMSQDFEVAIEEGATLVRVGEAIFGSRRQ